VSAAELLLPDQMTVQGAGVALEGILRIDNGVERERERIYYDTFDGLLRAAGLTLLHEDGRLALVERESGQVRATLPAGPPNRPVFAGDLMAGALHEALEPITGVRALLPLARLSSQERPLAVLDEERKTVVRVALEQPALIESGNGPTPLRPRVRLAGIRGYDKELARVQGALIDELGFTVADQLLVDEAVRAGGGLPGGLPSKVNVPLDFGRRADSAAVLVLRALLEVMELNVDGTVQDVDSEFLHDFRVSVRRSRAVQRELKGVFAPDDLARFRGEFRWLQQATGDARDLDVHVLEFDAMRVLVPEAMRDDLDPLLRVLRARRVKAHRALVRTLRSARATALLSDWSGFLDGLEAMPEDDRPDAARPIGEVAGKRIHKVYRRMLRMGEAIDEDSPADDYHELRKKGKELRYLLELFGAAAAGRAGRNGAGGDRADADAVHSDVVKPMIKTLKSLQDVLGRHQDREVQILLLRSLGPEVGAAQNGDLALMALGALLARLGEDEAAARGEFHARFSEFASAEQRRLVKATFSS
jgi:CHAD domain-containing protein